MPVYEYECPSGHRKDEIRKYEDRDSPTTCESEGCAQPMKRIPATYHGTVPGGTPKFYPGR